MALRRSFTEDRRTLRLEVGPRLDAGCHDDLRRILAASESRPGRIVVDLAETEYVDASGLDVLLVIREEAADAGASVSLTGCRATIGKILRLANFDRLFPIEWAG